MLNNQLILFLAFIALPAFVVAMFIVSLLEKRTALKQAKPKRKRRRLRLLTWLSSMIWTDDEAVETTCSRPASKTSPNVRKKSPSGSKKPL